MNRNLASVVAALALGLGGCASDPGASYYGGGMVYRDGGYYAPAREGYGDYYVAPEYSDDWYGDGPYFDPFYGPFYDPFVFGPSWYGGGGGYCSARYRYCPSGWYGAGSPFAFGFGTSLWLRFGSRSYYDPWGYYSPWAGGSERSHGWRPRHPRQSAPPVQGEQSPSWRPSTDALGRTDAANDGQAAEGEPDGRFFDSARFDSARSDNARLDNGRNRVPDERFLRRLPMRPQPEGLPAPIADRPVRQAQPRTDLGTSRGGDRVDRSGGGSRERSDGGDRARAQSDGDGSRPRGRRRDSEG